MKLIALDTSTEACSAALLIDGEVIEEYTVAPQQHAELILGMIDTVLAKAQCYLSQLDAVAFGRGPGSFVGVRVAASVAQGLAYTQNLPVVPISSLAAMAQGTKGKNHLLVAIDARMQEIYWAAYVRDEAGWVSNVGGEAVISPETAEIPLELATFHPSWTGIGTGWSAYGDILTNKFDVQSVDGEVLPRASQIALLAQQDYHAGKICSAFDALPVYLRDQVAKKANSE